MVSPELLRRYAFFSQLTPKELDEVAMISDEVTLEKGTLLFKECDEAKELYLLLKGSVDLFFAKFEGDTTIIGHEYFVSEVNAGEVLGISAMLDPYIYTLNARTDSASQVLKVNAVALRSMCDRDEHMALVVMQNIAQAFAHRLHDTRVQLAAARV